jgi:hypothetical protein
VIITLTAEEHELVLAFRRARVEYGAALTLADAIAGISEAIEQEILAGVTALDARLRELEGQDARRAAGGPANAAARYLATVAEASSFELREATGRLWTTEQLNRALKGQPDRFERLPNKPGRARAWWRLREEGEE